MPWRYSGGKGTGARPTTDRGPGMDPFSKRSNPRPSPTKGAESNPWRYGQGGAAKVKASGSGAVKVQPITGKQSPQPWRYGSRKSPARLKEARILAGITGGEVDPSLELQELVESFADFIKKKKGGGDEEGGKKKGKSMPPWLKKKGGGEDEEEVSEAFASAADAFDRVAEAVGGQRYEGGWNSQRRAAPTPRRAGKPEYTNSAQMGKWRRSHVGSQKRAMPTTDVAPKPGFNATQGPGTGGLAPTPRPTPPVKKTPYRPVGAGGRHV